MGELFDHLVMEGQGLLPLNEKQEQLFNEQTNFSLRWQLNALDFQKSVQQGMAEAIKNMEDFLAISLLFTGYKKYVLIAHKSPFGEPLNEEEFRSLLVWCGHGPALVSRAWVEIFKKAVKEHTENIHPGLKNDTAYPAYTFLQRVVDAVSG
jgi:hypothetical protein